ncbi:MAG TPA: alanine racemase [Firmicutes bacterium]|nr:alanine racemase [Bacillota bacterium]
MTKAITTRAEVSLDTLVENYAEVCRYVAPANVMAVVKGNAYGHGAVATAKALEEAGCRRFAVATVDEALELRAASVKADVHLLGGLTGEQLRIAVENDLIPFVPDTPRLILLNSFAREVRRQQRYHVKVDTGMGRLGVLPDALDEYMGVALRQEHLYLEGAATHLPLAAIDDPFNNLQFNRFREAARLVEQAVGRKILKHVAASCVTVRFREMHLDMVRVGSLLYGLCHIDFSNVLALKPVLALKTTIVQVKTVPAGWHAGYGATHSDHPRKLGLLPLGLVDGLMSTYQHPQVLIRGEFCPVLSIAADQTIADVSALKEVEVGDDVVVIGWQGGNVISANQVGIASGTNYGEILMKISHRVPHVYSFRGDLWEKRLIR